MKKSKFILKNSLWSRLKDLWPKPAAKAFGRQRAGGRAQPRQEGHQQPRYLLIEDAAAADHYFKRLQTAVYHHHSQRRLGENGPSRPRPPMFWEAGRLNPGRPYFYLKPHNELGWLFERSGLGWVVSRCEKIVEQGLFLRQNEPWDIAVLYASTKQVGLCRVSSHQTLGDLISFAVYEKLVLDQIWSEDDDGPSSLSPWEPSHLDLTF